MPGFGPIDYLGAAGNSLAQDLVSLLDFAGGPGIGGGGGAGGSVVLNVKDPAFGAKGNGVTDDAVAIQTAINQAAVLGGNAIVYLPVGTYAVGTTIYIPANIVFRGAGRSLTTIFALAGMNASVIRTQNFAALNGTNPSTNFGPGEFVLENFTVDGNRYNQNQAGFYGGIEIYGYDFRLNNLEIRNVQGRGLYTEWTNNSSGTLVDSMEANITHVKSHNNQWHGVHLNGPHDTIVTDVISFLGDTNSTGIYIDAKANGTQLVNCHSWGTTQAYAIQVLAQGVQIVSTQAEGAGIAQVWIQGNDCQFDGFVYGPASGNSSVAFRLGSASQSVTRWRISANTGSTSGGVIDFTYDGGYGYFNIVNYGINGATLFVGTPASSSGGLFVPQGQSYRGSNAPTTIGPWNADSLKVNGTLTVNSGQAVITGPGSTFTPLVTKGIAGQTADLFQAQNINGVAVTKIDPGGLVTTAGLTTNGRSLLQYLTQPQVTVSNVGVAGSLTVTYYVVARDSLGNSMISNAATTVNSNGTLSVANYNQISWPAVPGAATYDVLKGNTTTSLAVGVSAGPVNDQGQATSSYTLAAQNPTVITKVSNGQSSDAQQWQRADGTAITRVDSNGNLFTQGPLAVGSNSVSYSAQLYLNLATANTRGLVIQAQPAQNYDPLQYRNSAGTAIAGIDNNGNLYGVNGNLSGSIGAAQAFIGTNNASLGAALSVQNSNSATNPTVIIRNVASQTADSIQWQNSAGTVLAKVDSFGTIISSGVGSGLITLRSGDATHTGYVEFYQTSGVRQGYIGFSTSTVTTQDTGTINYAAGTHAFGGHVVSTAPAVTAAAGANAGTTPPAPVVGASNDQRGLITFGTGTTPAAGNQVGVTFGTAFSASPVVTISPSNPATAALNLYLNGIGTTGFTVACANAPAASQANTVYSFTYIVMG